MKKAVFMLK